MVSGLLPQSLTSLLLLLLVFACIWTRIRTGLHSRRQQASKTGPKEVAILPYWIPFLGHVFSFAADYPGFLIKSSKTVKDGVFRVVLAGTVHNVVIPPSVVQAIFSQKTAVNADGLAFRAIEKVFGADRTSRMEQHKILHSAHAPVARLNREPFVSDAAQATLRFVLERIHNLVSFSESWVDQTSWERVANASLGPKGEYVEADFFRLTQLFIGEIASTAMMGQDFMNNNPDVLNDLWAIDQKFPSLLLGLPWWLPGMGSAYRARRRLRNGIKELHQALYDSWDGKDPGSKYSDLSDVSNVIQDRAKAFRTSIASANTGGAGDLSLLWAMNANANQTIWWLLWRIYGSPSLREEIMKEIAPYATLSEDSSDLPIKELPRLKIDIQGLLHECPLLKSTFYETMRMVAAGTSYRTVVEDFSVTESAEDAALDGKAEPQTYQFNKGEYICMLHVAHTLDKRYWSDPEAFRPRRFIEDDVVETNEGKLGASSDRKSAVTSRTMKVFGGGQSICKGRQFVDREVAIFVAAILTVWDIEPVSGTWTHPGMVVGASAAVPKRNVRVRITRRAKARSG